MNNRCQLRTLLRLIPMVLVALAVACGAPWLTPTLSAQGTAQVGGVGGKTFVRMCPAGYFVVGFDGWHDQWMDRLRPRCKPTTNTGAWGSGPIYTADPFVGGKQGSGDPVPTECPTDAFVTELEVTHGAYVHGFATTCRRADGSRTNLDYLGDPGALELLGAVGEVLGGTRQETVTCPQGTRANGIVGKSGMFVDALRLECQSLTNDYVEDTPQEIGRAGLVPGGGGVPFVTECGLDERMVGVVAKSATHLGRDVTGVWLTSLRPICTQPPSWDPAAFATALSRSVNPATSRVGQVELQAQGSFATQVGGSDGEGTTLLCPRDTFVDGVEARHADFVNGIRLRCRPLDGGATQTTSLAGSDRDKRDVLQCPADMSAWGLVGRAGSSIDALRLRCRGPVSDVATPRLFAVLGDSYGSGEGAPDVELTSELGFIQGDSRSEEAGWIDRLCHRSEKAGLLKGVRDFHDQEPERFDFRTFACSGAEIYDGFMEAQSYPPEAGAPVDAQIEQVERWLSDRGVDEVDAIVMSVGGNDAGFALRIADCITGEIMEDVLLNFAQYNCGKDTEFRESVRADPAGLPTLYDDLAVRLERLNPRRVYIRTYPDVLRFEGPGGLEYCSGFADPGPEPPNGFTAAHHAYNNIDGLTLDATKFVDEEFVNVLNQHIVDAAQRHGWVAITGWYEASGEHGYCASDPWFNIPSASFLSQGDGLGIFHPNAAGFAVEAQLLEEELELTWSPPRPILAVGVAPAQSVQETQPPPNRIGTRGVAGRRPSVARAVANARGLRRRQVEWSVQGPDTDLAKLWDRLVYQLASVAVSATGSETSVELLPGHENTTFAIPVVGDASFTDHFVRSCEGDLCSQWSSGARVTSQAPLSLMGLTATPLESAATRLRRLPKSEDGGVRITWQPTEGPLVRVYEVAHGTAGTRGEVGRLSIARREVGQPGSEIRLGAEAAASDRFFVRACNDAGCSKWQGVAGEAQAPARPGVRSRVAGRGTPDLARTNATITIPSELSDMPDPAIEPLHIEVPPEVLRQLAAPRPG